jgi:hypothetical protein
VISIGVLSFNTTLLKKRQLFSRSSIITYEHAISIKIVFVSLTNIS